MPEVVILGGGFGGLAAAHELRANHPELTDLRVTLIDASDRFFMGFAKLWDLAAVRPLAEGTRRLAELEAHGVRVVPATATAIDPETRTVETDAGSFSGDALVVAVGAEPSPAHRALLSGPRAHDLYDGSQLPAMRHALDTVTDGRVLVAILGGPFKCPPAPFEAVLIVDEILRRRGVRDHVDVAISTFQPMTLPVAGPDASRFVAGHLGERGIDLLSPRKIEHVDHDTSTVRFDDGSVIEFTVLLGVPASVPPPLVTSSGLAGPSGWIEPDRYTMRTSFDRVYAVGDCTQIPTATAQLPKAGVFAAAQGVVAARNIAADLAGGVEARFDGHGFCFLELPGRQVAFVEGNFFAEPQPDVSLTPASTELFERKQAYERERLALWFS